MRGVRVERNVWVSNDNKKSVIDKKDRNDKVLTLFQAWWKEPLRGWGWRRQGALGLGPGLRPAV